MKIAVGCDFNALDLKNAIIDLLKERKVEYKDFGTFTRDPIDYPDIAKKVAYAIAEGKFERGILICGTGLGMAMAADKVKGIRAATCCNVYQAERAIKSNNAQIITLGALVTGIELAKMLVNAWLNSEFQGGRSERKVQKIMEIEKENFN
ncbi:MAG TPA: ribose 5-phosphate isomerase B [Candidatus Atribacteria bacterium]|nr:ribose 5-phosphate isomerase B [Candidatus Atribacteria bacterium]